MRRSSHFLLVAVLFGLGLAAGCWISVERRAKEFTAGVDREKAALERSTLAQAPAPTTPAFASRDELLTTLMGAVAEQEPLLRAHRIYELIGRLTSQELGDLFAHAIQQDQFSQRDTLLSAVLARWAAIDPAAAEAATAPYREKARQKKAFAWWGTEDAVNRAWAEAMPEKTLQEVFAAKDGPWARMTAWNALGTLAAGDAAAQLDLLMQFPASPLRANLCENALRTLADTDAAAAEARLGLLPDWQRSKMQNWILSKLAERDPAAALARFTELAPDLTAGATNSQMISSVLRTAAKKDAASALAVIDRLPPELQASGMNAALAGWAEREPIAALQWAEANGVNIANSRATTFFNGLFESGTNPLITIAMETDHTKTIEWLRHQPPSVDRDMMIRDGLWRATGAEKMELFEQLSPSAQTEAAVTVTWKLYSENPEKAEAWTKTLAPGPARGESIRALVSNQASNTPEQTETYLEAWSPGPDRDAALAGVAGALTDNDPQRALTFARQIVGSNARENSVEDIAQRWLYRDNRTARAWITTTPDLSAEQKRVLIRQFDER